MQDGRASLPGFVREWIERSYPRRVIRVVDFFGRYHDQEIECDRRRWRLYNALYLIRMALAGVPWLVRFLIGTGLWIYWLSPQWLKDWYWKTAA